MNATVTTQTAPTVQSRLHKCINGLTICTLQVIKCCVCQGLGLRCVCMWGGGEGQGKAGGGKGRWEEEEGGYRQVL